MRELNIVFSLLIGLPLPLFYLGVFPLSREVISTVALVLAGGLLLLSIWKVLRSEEGEKKITFTAISTVFLLCLWGIKYNYYSFIDGFFPFFSLAVVLYYLFIPNLILFSSRYLRFSNRWGLPAPTWTESSVIVVCFSLVLSFSLRNLAIINIAPISVFTALLWTLTKLLYNEK